MAGRKSKAKGYYGEMKTVKFFWSLGIVAKRLANRMLNDPDVEVGVRSVEVKQGCESSIPNPVRILLFGKRYNFAVINWVDNHDGFITMRLKDFIQWMPKEMWTDADDNKAA
jgi:hypothetical protein